MESFQCDLNGVKYILDPGPLSFTWLIEQDPEAGWILALYWSRPTQFQNLIWVRMVTLRLRPPWITHVAYVRARE